MPCVSYIAPLGTLRQAVSSHPAWCSVYIMEGVFFFLWAYALFRFFEGTVPPPPLLLCSRFLFCPAYERVCGGSLLRVFACSHEQVRC